MERLAKKKLFVFRGFVFFVLHVACGTSEQVNGSEGSVFVCVFIFLSRQGGGEEKCEGSVFFCFD